MIIDQSVKDNVGRRVLRNVTVLWGGQVVQLISMTAWLAIVARYIGPSTFGNYAYAQATVSILAIFVNLGIDPLLTRDLAQNAANARVYTAYALMLKLGLGIIVLGGYIFLMGWQGATPELETISIIVAANSLVSSLGTIFTSIINAREEIHYSVLAATANAVLTFLSGALGVWLGLPLALILFFSLSSTGVYLVLTIWFARGLYAWTGGPALFSPIRWRDAFALAFRSIPFAVMGLIASLSLNSGIMLLQFQGVENNEIGYFAAALRIYSMVIFVPGIVGGALFPSLSKAFVGPADRFSEIFGVAWRYLFAITVPMAMGLWLTSGDVLSLIYGTEFLHATRLLDILSLMLLNGVGYVMGPTMVAMNRQNLSMLILALTLTAQIIVSWFGIPLYGLEAPAWAMVGATLTGLVIYSTLLFRWLHLHFPLVWCLKTMLAVFVMAVVIRLVLDSGVSWLIASIIGLMVYVMSHLALRTFGARDWEMIAGLLPEGNFKSRILRFTQVIAISNESLDRQDR